MSETNSDQVNEKQDGSGFIRKLIMIKLIILVVVAVATVILVQSI